MPFNNGDHRPWQRVTLVGASLFLLAIFALGTTGVASAETISTCGELNESTTYELDQNVSGSDCLNITASGAVLDGGGYTVDGDIILNAENVTVTNLEIVPNGFDGIEVDEAAPHATIKNVVVNGGIFGLSAFHASNATFDSIEISGTSRAAIQVYDSNNTTLSNLSISDSGDETWPQIRIRWSSYRTTLSDSVIANGGNATGVAVESSDYTSISNVSITNNSVNFFGSDASAIDFSGQDPLRVGAANATDFELSSVEGVEGTVQFDQWRAVLNHSVESNLTMSEVPLSSGNSAPNFAPMAPGLSISGTPSGETVTITRSLTSSELDSIVEATASINRRSPFSWYPVNSTYDPATSEVTAVTAGGSYWAGGSDDVVDLSVSDVVVEAGQEAQLIANATIRVLTGPTQFTVTEDVDFSTTNNSLISLGSGGTVIGESPGDATVTASLEGETDQATVTVVDSFAEVPHTFYGNLTINGAPAPAGTTIEATIDGVPRGNVTIDQAGSYGGPGPLDERLAATGTEAETGDVIEFTITPPATEELIPATANQTATFSPEESSQLNLTASLETQLPPKYDLTLQNDGGVKTVGIPGPHHGTLEDFFTGYDGVETLFTYQEGRWEQIHDANHTFDPLEVLVVVTSGQGPGIIPVDIPLQQNVAAEPANLSAGWNVIAAPKVTTAEDAFGSVAELTTNRYEQPIVETAVPGDSFDHYVSGSNSWGVSPPTVSPFAGYVVYAPTEATIPVTASDIEYKQKLDDRLGLDD